MRLGFTLLCLFAIAYAIEIASAAPTRTSTRKRTASVRTPTRKHSPTRAHSRTSSRTRSRSPLRTASPLRCKPGPFPVLSTVLLRNFFASSQTAGTEDYRFARTQCGGPWKSYSPYEQYVEVDFGGSYHIQRIELDGGPFLEGPFPYGADASLVKIEVSPRFPMIDLTTVADRIAPGVILLNDRTVVARIVKITVLKSNKTAGLRGEIYVYPGNLYLNGIPPVLRNHPGPICSLTQSFPLLELLSNQAFSSSSSDFIPPSSFTRSAPQFWMSTGFSFSVNLGAFHWVQYVEVSGGPFSYFNLKPGAYTYTIEYSSDGHDWQLYEGSGYLPAGQNGQYTRYTPTNKLRVQYLRFSAQNLCSPSNSCYDYPALKGEVYVRPGCLSSDCDREGDMVSF